MWRVKILALAVAQLHCSPSGAAEPRVAVRITYSSTIAHQSSSTNSWSRTRKPPAICAPYWHLKRTTPAENLGINSPCLVRTPNRKPFSSEPPKLTLNLRKRRLR